MEYIYPIRVPLTNGSVQHPAKRNCIKKGKQSLQVASSSEAGAEATPELPNVSTLPPGFPSPPAGYEQLFEAWRDRWRKSHGAAKAIGELQERLLEFKDAAEVLQNTNLIPQRNLITKLRHDIVRAEEKLVDEDMAVYVDGKEYNPARIKEFEYLIDRLTIKLTKKEKELDQLGNTKNLDKARFAIQELLGTSSPAGVNSIGKVGLTIDSIIF
ncbi:hypothetical protein H4S08_001110 [Coemansia sp. RSA 1365]|nr:hypothetical protein H4S08_001110 [Coemansia sp. RSA 1365]